MTFHLTPAAEADLAEIADYIATESSADRAAAVVQEIFRAAAMLAESPRVGHTRRDLTDEPVLVWPVYSYLVFYEPVADPLMIVRVVHGARGPTAIQDALRDRDG